MDLLNETRKLMMEEDYFDYDDDDWYEPTEEEIAREDMARARRLFPVNIKDTEGDTIDTSNMRFEDIITKAGELANFYKVKAVEEFGLSMGDLQGAKISKLPQEEQLCIRSWRIWQRFLNAFGRYKYAE